VLEKRNRWGCSRKKAKRVRRCTSLKSMKKIVIKWTAFQRGKERQKAQRREERGFVEKSALAG